MKKLLSIIILFYSYSCNAQNYQCLQSGVKHYFTNGNGYLRGIRIDSVKTSGSDIIYYPFHTPRGPYNSSAGGSVLDSNGGSWLGKKVIQHSDGTFVFDDIWSDSVIIKTQANFGSSWIFYKDTSSLYYIANIVSIDTMAILGSMDTVKTILINAYNGTTLVTTDPVNNFQIILSKNHGFAQVFDLCTFPYHKPDSAYRPGLDLYLDKSSTTPPDAYHFIGYSPSLNVSIFNLIPFINPTNQQLYDFNTGDIYEYQVCMVWDAPSCNTTHFESDTITEKILLSNSTKYHFTGLTSTPNPFSNYYPDSGAKSITTNNLFLVDTLLMPEEYKENNICYYLSNDTSFCRTGPYYDIVPSYINGIHAPFYFEGAVTEEAYKLGLGQVKYFFDAASNYWFTIKTSDLVYYKRDINSCGVYYPVSSGIKELRQNEFQIFPNPATTSLTITATNKITTITITNLLGQTVYTHEYNNEKVEVNVAGLQTGVYFVKINGVEVRKFVKE